MNTQHILLAEAATASSLTDAGKTFQEVKLQEYEKLGKFLTSKQIGFIQEGVVPEYLSIFKPDSRDSAIFQGFYGLSCPGCLSWRVVEPTDNESGNANLKCLDCGDKFKGKTVSKCPHCQVPLYKEDLLHIVKKGRCKVKSCQYEFELPKELADYAQS